MLFEYIKLMRPKSYVKNIFVFAPLMFSFNYSLDLFFNTLVVFVLFSLLASSIYVYNDLKDINEDKLHPKKCKRPLASGKVSQKSAMVLIGLLSVPVLIFAFYFNKNLFGVLLLYFFMNIAYSLKLKHIPIIDISIIAIGFVLRLFAGSVVLNVSLSMWIIIMTFILALFLGIAKRRDDVLLASQGKRTRKNIDGYNLEFINVLMALMSGVIIVAYISYTVSPEIINKFGSNKLYLTSFFVILGIMRYMQITFVYENSGSPVKIVLKDLFLQIIILLWLLSFFAIVNF